MQGVRTDSETAAKIVELYVAGSPMHKIPAQAGCGISTVFRTLKRAGVDSRPRRKDFFNEAFFGDITTEAQSYVLGFLAADGVVSAGKYACTCAVSLNRKDEAHLEKIKQVMGSTCKILRIQSQNSSRISFHSPRLVADLIRHGVTPCKSHTCAPWEGPAHMLRHWWRGVFDGDGSWTTIQRKSGPIPAGVLSLCGTLKMTEGFARFVHASTGVHLHVYPCKSIFAAVVQRMDDIKQVVRLLWEGSTIFLDRKKTLADWALARQRGVAG